MTSRNLKQTAVAAAMICLSTLAVVAMATCDASAAKPDVAAPNILFIVADDKSYTF